MLAKQSPYTSQQRHSLKLCVLTRQINKQYPSPCAHEYDSRAVLALDSWSHVLPASIVLLCRKSRIALGCVFAKFGSWWSRKRSRGPRPAR
eukprot:6180380-Pleurochrysis_carterae.AAC.3